MRDLKVQFKTDDGVLKAVDGVSYDVYPNEVLGIVGESGSGKSVTSLAVMGLLPKSAKITGEIVFRGQDLLRLPESERRKLRGGRIAMVFQDALAALNPVFTVGRPDRGGDRQPSAGHEQSGQAQAGGRAARHRRHPQPASPGRPVSARVLRAACASGP